ncbi:hypothetical protein BLOT_012844 [Blomia tropicalis]|nr:hypothetical protein BLOT_012844 [Blomia tropicalis]
MTHQWIDELIIINLVVLIMMMMMINGSNGQTSTNPMTQQWPLRFHRSPNWLQKEFIIPSEPSTNEVNGNNCDDGNNIDDISNQMSECQAKRECTYAPSMHCAQRMRTVNPRPDDPRYETTYRRCHYLTESIIDEMCRHENKSSRKALIRHLSLRSCRRFALERTLSQHLYSLVVNTTECGNILRELLLLDEKVEELACEFESILQRYDCEAKWSVKWTCRDCRLAYRDWLCSTLIPYHTMPDHNISKPCQSVCEQVEQRCPHLNPYGKSQYAGEPVFLCIDRKIPFNRAITPEMPYGDYDGNCYSVCDLETCLNDENEGPALECPKSDPIVEKKKEVGDVVDDDDESNASAISTSTFTTTTMQNNMDEMDHWTSTFEPIDEHDDSMVTINIDQQQSTMINNDNFIDELNTINGDNGKVATTTTTIPLERWSNEDYQDLPSIVSKSSSIPEPAKRLQSPQYVEMDSSNYENLKGQLQSPPFSIDMYETGGSDTIESITTTTDSNLRYDSYHEMIPIVTGTEQSIPSTTINSDKMKTSTIKAATLKTIIKTKATQEKILNTNDNTNRFRHHNSRAKELMMQQKISDDRGQRTKRTDRKMDFDEQSIFEIDSNFVPRKSPIAVKYGIVELSGLIPHDHIHLTRFSVR